MAWWSWQMYRLNRAAMDDRPVFFAMLGFFGKAATSLLQQAYRVLSVIVVA
jgi:hypothetical protein